MRQRWIRLVVVAGLFGCGGRAASETASEGSEASGGETASSATGLRGTVGGQPWEARTAVAGYSITDQEADRNIVLYPFVVSCADIAEGRWPAEAEAGMRDVSVTLTYTDGFTASPPDGTFERSRSSQAGTVTVMRAGATGLLRLEMQGEDPAYDSVAGEIEVTDCGPSATVRGLGTDRGTRLALAR